jgi:hypothetical protein
MSASKALANHFEQNQGIPISRSAIEAIAQQLDPMKRLRRNGGARDILHKKSIALLWGKGDRALIAQLNLGPVSASEFIAYTPKNPSEVALIRAHGHLTS